MEGDPVLRLELNLGSGPTAPDPILLDTGRLDVNALEIGSSASWLVLDSSTLGQLDQERLAADATGAGFWTDISSFCAGASIRTGRNRALESYMAGALSAALDNEDRRFDPTNAAGPYVSAGGLSAIEPMRPIRAVVTWKGNDYPLFYGFVDAWPVIWSMATSTANISATDGMKVLAAYDPSAIGAVGAGEDSGERVNRVLDNAGWPATARSIDAGNSPLQATTLAANALAEIKLVADTERGQFYMDGLGRATFRRRRSRYEDARSIQVQATFGDADDGIEIPYADVVAAFDDDLLRNQASIARVGGTAQTASDGASISRRQPHTYTRTDLIMTTDAEAADHARSIVQIFGSSELRFDGLVLEPATSAEWAAALNLRFGDRLLIRRRPPGGGLIERQCFVEGLSWDMPADRPWRCNVSLSDASAWRGFVLDSATLGVLDDASIVLTY
ncbi:MAG TPA: hypothetical protein VFJ85_02820 [Acidimicrobiales bacterium]|nr:hypothetical protein [Acidimicrobiales bacterium]